MSRKPKLPVAAVITSAVLALSCGCDHELESTQRADVPLATGRWLEGGFAEASQDVGSLPVNLLLSPDGKYRHHHRRRFPRVAVVDRHRRRQGHQPY